MLSLGDLNLKGYSKKLKIGAVFHTFISFGLRLRATSFVLMFNINRPFRAMSSLPFLFPSIIKSPPLDGMYDRIIEAFKNLGLSNTLKVIDTDSSNAAAYFATQGKGVALVIDSPPMQLFPLERRPIIDPEFRFFLYLDNM